MSLPPELYISALRLTGDDNYPLIDPLDHSQLQRLIAAAFPDRDAQTLAAEARPLFRVDWEGGEAILYVQSWKPPAWVSLPAPFTSLSVAGPKPLVLPPLANGSRLRFRLLAYPSKRLFVRGGKGQRVALLREDERRRWLERQGQEHGFQPLDYVLAAMTWFDSKNDARLPNGACKPLSGTRFDGVLVVTNPDLLRSTVAAGIGSGKAFGFGLLSLAPAGG